MVKDTLLRDERCSLAMQKGIFCFFGVVCAAGYMQQDV